MVTVCEVLELGLVDYQSSLNLQNNLLSARLAGKIPDSILLLEHPPVFTVGVSGRDEHIRVSSSVLHQEGIPIMRVDRGGSVTFHGPGQIIGYFIMDLNAKHLSIHQFVFNLVEVIIQTLDSFSIVAARDRDYPGVWVDLDKICAIGVRVVNGCTKHGFALNVNTDLKYFDYIIPCGIKNRGVTSISKLLGSTVSPDDVISCIIENCARIFDLKIYFNNIVGENGI